MEHLSRESIVIYAGEEFNETRSVTPPIYQTSTFTADDGDMFAKNATSPMPSEFYTRYGNPTLKHAAAIIARLENAEEALVFGSGVGAAATTALALLKSGDHVVAQRVLYTGTIGLLEEILTKFGVETTFVDQEDPAAFAEAIRPNTRLIWTETPSNPMLQITDLAAIAALAKERGILTLCDNTIGTPMNQRPIESGIDLVLHSATKAMAGHCDIIAGAIAGSRLLVEKIWAASIVVGATLGPFEAWLLLRGLRTLPLRSARLDKTAYDVAEFLSSHDRVRAVNYPGLVSHPQHALAARQMTGFGCLLSFELDGDGAIVERFISHLKHVKYAVSLGGVESLIGRPGEVWSAHSTPDDLAKSGISRSLLRLSVGLEHADDLKADIANALKAAFA